jgi:hypothetical protein
MLPRLVRLTNLLRLGLALAMPLAIVACGDQTANDAPIIDSVEAPLAVTAQNGSYAIPVTVLFHDNDGEAITRLHYRLPPNIDGMVDVPEPNPTRESALVTIVIPASALDEDTSTTPTTRSDDHGSDGHGGSATDDHGRPPPSNRHQPRSLQLSIVDGRGAESLPTSSTVTLN